MNVLVACEESQAVCKAFRERGHNAFSCDILECSGGHPEWHFKQDVLQVIPNHGGMLESGTEYYLPEGEKWDLMMVNWSFPKLLNEVEDEKAAFLIQKEWYSFIDKFHFR